MLIPHPESDLRQNVMVHGIEILNLIKADGRVFTELALECFLKGDIRRTPEEFMNSLLFLYTVGLIEQESYWLKLKEKTN